MSLDRFNDDCKGCQPALLDAQTGQKVPDDDPMMKAIMKVWATTPRVSKQAYHRVTCQNSRDPNDLRLVQTIIEKFQKAMPAS